MNDKGQLDIEIKRLLELDEQDLERELVGAVSRDEEFLAKLNLPQTVPSEPVSQAFASMNFSKRLERVRGALEEAFKKNRERLYELICVKLEYCEQRGAGEVRMISSILAVLMGKGVILVAYPKLWPLPIVIVYLYKNGFFDRLCKCPKK